MARIEGVDLPRNKRIETALTYIYGIGLTRSQKILSDTGVNPDVRVRDLSDNDENLIRDYIAKNYTVEGDLRREVQMNIKRLVEIGCYRGMRHRRNLPCRGQRTRTNARTAKGPKKTVAVEQPRNNSDSIHAIYCRFGVPFPLRLPAIFVCLEKECFIQISYKRK